MLTPLASTSIAAVPGGAAMKNSDATPASTGVKPRVALQRAQQQERDDEVDDEQRQLQRGDRDAEHRERQRGHPGLDGEDVVLAVEEQREGAQLAEVFAHQPDHGLIGIEVRLVAEQEDCRSGEDGDRGQRHHDDALPRPRPLGGGGRHALGACPSNRMGRAHGACEARIEARGGGDAAHRRRRATTSSPATPMRPAGSGGAPASAALPLLDNVPHCLRRGALQLPVRRSERDPCHYSDRLLMQLLVGGDRAHLSHEIVQESVS